MRSRVVDALWLAFSRQQTGYARYCRQALGRTLPLTPTVALSQALETNAALRRCWWHACREENIDPRKPTRPPLLFALDTKLKIRDGFYYFTDDFARRRKVERSDDSGNGSSVSYDSERSWTPEDLQAAKLGEVDRVQAGEHRHRCQRLRRGYRLLSVIHPSVRSFDRR